MMQNMDLTNNTGSIQNVQPDLSRNETIIPTAEEDSQSDDAPYMNNNNMFDIQQNGENLDQQNTIQDDIQQDQTIQQSAQQEIAA